MSEGLRRIATVIRVLGWLWLALFLATAAVLGYGSERNLTRDELIALYEQETHSKLVEVVAAQRAAVAPGSNNPSQKTPTVEQWLGETKEPSADTVLAAHFQNRSPSTRNYELFAAALSAGAGAMGLGLALALAWIITGFAVDRTKRSP